MAFLPEPWGPVDTPKMERKLPWNFDTIGLDLSLRTGSDPTLAVIQVLWCSEALGWKY